MSAKIVLLLATALLPAGSLRMRGTSAEEPKPKTAHIYVMNLDQRQDRCSCMKKTIGASPYPVFRHSAVTPANMAEKCPRLAQSQKGDDKLMNEKNRAVWCTQQMIFDRAMSHSNPPDYVILLEDDLKLEQGFWPKLQQFLNGCMDDSWDLTAVDTFYRKTTKPALKGNEVCKYMDAEFSLYHDHPDYFGAHMQIIPFSKLEKFQKRAVNIPDHWQAFLKDNIKTKFWQPNMVSQFSTGNRDGDSTRMSKLEDETMCDSTVAQSDNSYTKLDKNQKWARVSLDRPRVGGGGEKTYRLNCM